jgi:hypothetical protein
MADAYLTSADIVKLNRVDLDIVIRNVLEATPFLNMAAARPVASDNFKYPRVSGLPTVGYRAVNDGVENVKSTFEQINVDLKYLDASFAVDIAAAKVDERGVDHLMALEALNHLRAAMRIVESNIFNATSGGFASLPELSTLSALGTHCIVPGTPGTTASAQTSVYALKMGADGYEVLWGEGGEISVSERMMVERAGSVQGRFWSYAHEISSYCAHKIGSDYSVHRLANVETALDDDDIAALLNTFPVGFDCDVIVMNRKAAKLLRESRTATNPTGQPAPWVESAFGKPIVVVDTITNTEAIEV